mmetsp:Transcript_66074/g.170092  ORF Transcript_66074/g.170092 Transcript_66074/m.170092 type:complete len:227 (-) Transcript_66074:1008-1688(-)
MAHACLHIRQTGSRRSAEAWGVSAHATQRGIRDLGARPPRPQDLGDDVAILVALRQGARLVLGDVAVQLQLRSHKGRGIAADGHAVQVQQPHRGGASKLSPSATACTAARLCALDPFLVFFGHGSWHGQVVRAAVTGKQQRVVRGTTDHPQRIPGLLQQLPDLGEPERLVRRQEANLRRLMNAAQPQNVVTILEDDVPIKDICDGLASDAQVRQLLRTMPVHADQR